MERITIKAIKRTETGKNANHRLRQSGNIPINITGNGKSTLGSVDAKEMAKTLNTGVRAATVLNLNLEGDAEYPVIIKEVQRTPGTNSVRHIDFYKISPNKKIIAKVGINTFGSPKGTKAGGQFEHLIHELKIKSPSEDLIDNINIDVTDMEIGHQIKVSQLPMPKSWEVLLKGDPVVASVNMTRALLAAERSEKMAAGKDTAKGKKK
ncbi:MAG: 50S ribosomal protein L25 [Leptospiraceae bacterium]|nr:50S ribosomal protein L25 [Leptospiraceae bacterium]MCP5493506.1 50S ribosomal protein L25 [Leptospiraceae bacterium]